MSHTMTLRNRNRAQSPPRPLSRKLKLADFTALQQTDGHAPIEMCIETEHKIVNAYGYLHHLLAQVAVEVDFDRDADIAYQVTFWLKWYLMQLKAKARDRKSMKKEVITKLGNLQTCYTSFLTEKTSRKYEILKKMVQQINIFEILIEPLLAAMRAPRITQGLRRLLAEKIEGHGAVPPPAIHRPMLAPARTIATSTHTQTSPKPPRRVLSGGFTFDFAPPTLPQFDITTNGTNAIAADISSLPQRAVASRTRVFGARKRRTSSSSHMEDKSPEEIHRQKRTKHAEGDFVDLARRRRLRAVRRQQEDVPTPDIPAEELERIKNRNRREVDEVLAEVGGGYGGLTFQQLVQLQQYQQVQGLDLGLEERHPVTKDMSSTHDVPSSEERDVAQSNASQGLSLDLEDTMDLNLNSDNVYHNAIGEVVEEIVDPENLKTPTEIASPIPVVAVQVQKTEEQEETLPQDSKLPASQSSQKSSSSGTTSGTYFSCRSSQPNTTDEEENLESGDELENGANEGIEISTNENVEPEEDDNIAPGQEAAQGHDDGDADMDQSGVDNGVNMDLDLPAAEGTQDEEQRDAEQEMDTTESPVAPESKPASWFSFSRWFRRSGGQ